MQTNTDPYLVQQALEGNTDAFGKLVKKYESFVYTIVIRIVKVKEEAEEVSQDTFIKAYQSLSSYRGESKFSSWLYSIAYRKALDALRKNKKNNTYEIIEEITEGEFSTIDNALSYLEDQERNAMIKKCILALPELEATIITLFYFEEQSIKEIAEITQLTEDNIKVKLFRSRKKLFGLLKQYIEPESIDTSSAPLKSILI